MRKQILFHAFVILTGSFVLGLVVGAAQGSGDAVKAKAWLISHVTGIMVALIMAVVGLLWSDLNLGRRASKTLYWSTVHANYVVMVILGVLSPLLGAVPALAVPEAMPPTGAVKALFISGVVIATVTSFIMSILVLVGLRDRRPADL